MIYVSYDDCDGLLRVCVSDSGKGIKMEEQKEIFKKFGKLKRTAKMNSEGIGLGLLISRRLVEAYGGELHVASLGVDRGTQFMFQMKMESYPSTIDGSPQIFS